MQSAAATRAGPGCSLCGRGSGAPLELGDRRIRAPLALAIASGVPALVLVSVGPIASITGSVSVVIWLISSVVGALMCVVFAELVRQSPRQAGGVASLSANALRPYSRKLALLGQWSYWLGWSPALAISAGLLGSHIQRSVWPDSSSWVAYALATVVLAASALVNHFGLRTCARLQAVVAVGVVAPVLGLFIAVPLLRGGFDLSNFSPFNPPGGWSPLGGVVAISAALFLAGWSAYGAEVALTYAPEYGRETSPVRSLAATAAISVAVFSVVPIILIGVVGVDQVSGDPVQMVASVADRVGSWAPPLFSGLFLGTLVLTLNMIAVGSSRLLFQMGRNGDAWAFFGRTNRHGVPGNALAFDVVANSALLAVALQVNGGRVADVPTTVLATASVGYFVSLVLALFSVTLTRRDHSKGHRPLNNRFSGIGRLAAGLGVFNILLLTIGSAVWGLVNVALAVLILLGVVLLFGRNRPVDTGIRERACACAICGSSTTFAPSRS